MTEIYYHATDYKNLGSILEKGILKGYDGFVYLTTSPIDATKFLTIRGCDDILVCKVALEEDLIEESFDHNEKFFRCKAYMYGEDISTDEIINLIRYTRED